MGLVGLMGGCRLMPILPIRPIKPIMPMTIPVGLPRPVHLFLYPSVLEEVFLLPFYKTFYQHVALVYQRDSDIGYGLIRAVFYLLAVYRRIQMVLAELARLYTAWVVVGPLLQTSHSQVVLIVEQQLVQRGSIDVG